MQITQNNASTEASPSDFNMQTIIDLTQGDMNAVNDVIQTRLHSEVALINQLGHYIINSGGKRLRPLLALLTAQAFDYKGKQHIEIAAIIEFIHTATLLHDDVVDGSEMRRGQDTANNIWGNEASVLVGDFLYSRAFEMMVDIKNMRVMEILAHATNTIAEGEVLQLLNCHDADTSEERYLEVIHSKTAKLFEAATRLGAIISQRSDAEEKAMAAYGMHLGTAFQLVDDVLDYSSSADEIGKNIGDDLAEGKPTLPLIHAMRTGSAEQAQIIRSAIENGDREKINAVIEAVNTSGSITYTAAMARQEANLAIDSLADISPSQYKDALLALANFSVDRTY
ncbi:MAG TPA: octaprenyl diphosphate synthase [Candidatus Tenderia electrophaga]|uniref:Octaprenyl diphosphate synthase n=1 Tax=Candidatus Tenderia electrophaga TaxID=1748243 RepID=A0A832J4A4_9GAMM|nr:octaprenyl diphosphate synthase [Candidatus Tenderia electrophaga]